MAKLTGTTIVKRFELYTDDQTELSTEEEIALANSKAQDIYNENVWEFLRKNATGSFVNGEINLATVAPDFSFLMANYSEDEAYGTPTIPVVFVGGVPYKVITMGLRQQSQGQPVCWVDSLAKKIKFANPAIGGNFDFDYQHIPADITASTFSALPDGHDMIIVYAMLIDDDVIQKTEKGRSNYKENTASYVKLMSNLKSHNAKFMLHS